MEAARQIDRQLEKIESSLQENREILKQIRANIHEAELGRLDTKINSSVDRDASKYYDSIRLKDNLFYSKHSLPNCVNPSSLTSGDVNMARVYEELPFDDPDGGVWKQGWEVKAPPEEFAVEKQAKLKVFVVPHSHNDPGWIKTFDAYFREQTKAILTNAVEQMSKNKEMRFIWAETSYLSAWWETAPTEQHRDLMRQLIKEGRFEIVTGGWVMNDEANTQYFSMISQMIEGHEWLQDTFKVTPKHGWAIDPFGMSPTMAYLLKKMGFRGMVIQRVHYTIKKYLAKRKELEFRWKQSWEDAGDDILCHLEPFYSYDVPHTCGPDPSVCCQFDFKRLPGSRVKCPWKIPPKVVTNENVEERAKLLLDQYRKKSKLYKTNTLLVPLGDDFRYDKAKEWTDQFVNYKKLMDYLNSHEEFNVEIKFGTLSDYFTTLFQNTGIAAKRSAQMDTSKYSTVFPSLVGDFFTYSDREDHYWSGYYTSKPFYKRFERVLESHLRATEILFVMANVAATDFKRSTADPFEDIIGDFVYARQNLALFQHHDGITGTAKDFVVKDYANRMYRSFGILEKVASASLQAIAANQVGQKSLDLKSAPLSLEFMERFPSESTPLRKKIFSLGSGEKHYFVLYNSLGWTQESQVFCFAVNWTSGAMPTDWCLSQSGSGQIIDDLQINHIWSMEQLVENQREICFQPSLSAVSLEQFCLGDCRCGDQEQTLATLYQKKESFVTLYNSHRRQASTVPTDSHILSKMAPPPKENLTIENERVQLKFDAESGLLKRISILDPVAGADWIHLDAKAQLMTYGTRKGGKSVPKSGAYLFLPDGDDPKPWNAFGKPIIRVTSGRIESRYELILSEPLSMYIRFSLYRGRRSVELTTEFHLMGLYAANRELMMRFEVPAIENHDRFYTDLNGFQMIGRKWYSKIPLQGNVYPLNTMAFFEGLHKGQNLRFNIISGQPLGVTSSKTGTFDVFLDRRLTQDDARGLNQGVIDNKRTRETFRLLIEQPSAAVSVDNPKQTSGAMFESQSLLNPIIGMASSGPSKASSTGPILPESATSHQFLLPHSLPCDHHLLSLRRATKRPTEVAILLHRFGLSCDSSCVVPAANNVSISNLFPAFVLSKFQSNRLVPRGISLLDPPDEDTDRELPLSASLNIPPMEIVAYKMYMKNDNE